MPLTWRPATTREAPRRPITELSEQHGSIVVVMKRGVQLPMHDALTWGDTHRRSQRSHELVIPPLLKDEGPDLVVRAFVVSGSRPAVAPPRRRRWRVPQIGSQPRGRATS